MDEDSKIDARDRREGGWSWFQQELLYVFTPLIGPDAAWLYTVMCHLIPQAVEDPLFKLTIRTISKYTSMSIGTVHRKMALLTALGMIEEIKGERGRPSLYSLPSLRKLAALGTVEHVKRLKSVPGWNTSTEGAEAIRSAEEVAASAKRRSIRAGADEGAADVPMQGADAPGGSDSASVPRGNTSAPDGPSAPVDVQVFQKTGVSVPENGGERSKNPGEVFQPERSLINPDRQTEEINPLPPTGAAGLILPFANRRKGDDGYALCVGVAARWVMAECGITKDRLATAIHGALHLRCDRAGVSVEQAAATAVLSWREYHADVPLMRFGPWGAGKFFGEGYWLNRDSWPYDDAKVKELQGRGGAAVGMYRPPSS